MATSIRAAITVHLEVLCGETAEQDVTTIQRVHAAVQRAINSDLKLELIGIKTESISITTTS